jgi:transcriptional regulator with XRE-family HTH domain
MTQQEMADKWGVTKAAYAKYETGDRRPDNEKLGKLAKSFNLDLNSLIISDHSLLVKWSLPSNVKEDLSCLLDTSLHAKNFHDIVSKLTDIQEAHNRIINLLTKNQEEVNTDNLRDDFLDLRCFANGEILISYQRNEEINKLLDQSVKVQKMLLKSLNNLHRQPQ